ncbi:MAG: aminotransferase class V-fold PLP-dependent enzyme [Eubacterium sp.]|nr:aminotransferase class V-fold PLP-dependent enzyme [Eubacterium sp.]
MLTEQLKRYDESNIYPFHMPGHKRRICLPKDVYHLDITEIDGFDNLHAASGILAEEQRRYADLVGAKQSYFLVNGSTCGILAAISATVPRKGTILIARNSHKSAYNAMYMRQLYAEYVYPEMTHLDIQGMICREQVEAILQTRKNISAVYLTSPTYDGIVSDIASIAQVVHKYNLPLIVDEAHGAHFGMHPMFPQSAVHLGADLVIQSVHKTLPAFTQSAVLHICSDRVSKEEIERFLAIYESSSPSYVLMAGISRARAFLETEGAERFGELEQNLKRFYEKTTNLRALHVMRTDEFEDSRVYAKDPSKILIRTEGSSINGKQLYDLLLKRYGLQLEMCSGEYISPS